MQTLPAARFWPHRDPPSHGDTTQNAPRAPKKRLRIEFFALRVEFFAVRVEFFGRRLRFSAVRVEAQRVRVVAYVRAAGFYARPANRYAATEELKQAPLRFFAEPTKLNAQTVSVLAVKINRSGT